MAEVPIEVFLLPKNLFFLIRKRIEAIEKSNPWHHVVRVILLPWYVYAELPSNAILKEVLYPDKKIEFEEKFDKNKNVRKVRPRSGFLL